MGESRPNDISEWQEEYNGITTKTVCSLYDRYSDAYNKIVGSYQDDGHRLTVGAICALIPNKSSRILDFAAGTGLFGKILQNNSYTNIDALDGSELSIEQARKENIYTKLMVEFVEDKGLSLDSGSYDALVCYGGFAYNHLPVSVFSEWIRCVKSANHPLKYVNLNVYKFGVYPRVLAIWNRLPPGAVLHITPSVTHFMSFAAPAIGGGYIFNSFRLKWMTYCPMYNEGKLEAEMERLEKEKKWTLISRDVVDADEDACVVMYIHKVC